MWYKRLMIAKLPEKFPADLESAVLNALGIPASEIPKRLAVRLRELWPLLAKDLGRAAAGTKHYSFSRDLANAYLAYYLPANALKIAAVLEEARMAGLAARIFSSQGDEVVRWMDLGAGPGTLGLGLTWWAKQAGISKISLELVEQSDQFLNQARAVLGGKATYSRLDARKLAAQFKNSAILPDVISCQNSWVEFGDVKGMQEIVEIFLSRKESLERPRWLVLIEPGSKNASRALLELREQLRQNPRLKIWLPCMSERLCGALAKPDDWCHEDIAAEFPQWHADLGAQAGLRKESLLFSYLIVSIGGEEALSEFSKAWPVNAERMVSQRMVEKGLTQCFFCTEEGKRKYRILDSRRTGAPDLYDAFDNLRRGDILQGSKVDEKGNVLELGRYCFSETSIKSPIITES